MAKRKTNPDQTDIFSTLSVKETKKSLDPRDQLTKKSAQAQRGHTTMARCGDCIWDLTCMRKNVILDSTGHCSGFRHDDPSGRYFVLAILDYYRATGKPIDWGKNLSTSKQLARELRHAMVNYNERLSWPGVRVNWE